MTYVYKHCFQDQYDPTSVHVCSIGNVDHCYIDTVNIRGVVDPISVDDCDIRSVDPITLNVRSFGCVYRMSVDERLNGEYIPHAQPSGFMPYWGVQTTSL